MFKIVKNKKKGVCQAARCKNPNKPKDRFCHKHSHRYQKAKNLISYTFNLLKSNARKRKKGFDLTLPEFKNWCEENNYIDEKGRKANSATIDRIDHRKGYSIDNIQVLTKSENSKKRHTDLEEDDCPF